VIDADSGGAYARESTPARVKMRLPEWVRPENVDEFLDNLNQENITL
jgi:hypothetical protein